MIDPVLGRLTTGIKINYRCYIRKKMIEMGIVEWLVNYLDNFDEGNWQVPYTPYGLEYSTALFMNLCLHKSGKQKCFPMAKLVLEMLTQLLSSSSKQVVELLVLHISDE